VLSLVGIVEFKRQQDKTRPMKSTQWNLDCSQSTASKTVRRSDTIITIIVEVQITNKNFNVRLAQNISRIVH